ncbi:hypothetical protein GYMLUDRAFT_181732 [Collybiopsis luxurians FD-317 M1]|uniref:Glutaminase A central domain-containing protein n=1 Tax=Collybiopsis luxurians FD-317 M1 TaxID=944289 RepID=A0A0D0C8T3_9AGAR|nr:hypothetical protein GYMLUDRAFT_181732 [Collybiopsis luxurians FD-317 M1]
MGFSCAAQPFGLAYDSSNDTVAQSHWTLLTAGTSTDTNTRDSLVALVHAAASNREAFVVFLTTYSATDGSIIGGAANPAQGSMYALLALK